MNNTAALVVPSLLAFVAIYALSKRIDVFSSLTHGVSEGLKTVVRIFPALVALMTGIYMLQASGLTEALSEISKPVLASLGIPAETVPLMLIRPLSGSGALAVGSEIIKEYGADSVIGRTAAVMLGSTETTFYVIAVYFGAAGLKRSRGAVPAALIADFAGFTAAALFVRLFF